MRKKLELRVGLGFVTTMTKLVYWDSKLLKFSVFGPYRPLPLFIYFSKYDSLSEELKTH